MFRPIASLASLTLLAVLVLVRDARADSKKYHFELFAITAKPEVKPDTAKDATPRVEAQVKKVFEKHPQLVAKLDGAPDWKADAEGYRRFLVRTGLSGAYLVSVEITAAEEELVPMESKPGEQRLSVRLAIHMLGENIPGKTMGFTGDGKATIKQEVGKKMRPRDREYAWEQAAELAIDDAMKTVFGQLAKPQKKQ